MRSLRDITVFAHALDAIDDEEFALLYDVTKPKSPMVPFWRYQSFDLKTDNWKAAFTHCCGASEP